MLLNKVSIGIKTFLRDAALLNTINAIHDTMPEVTMIIADDGEMSPEKNKLYADLRHGGHIAIMCDFDAGFGYKSNRIADALQTPFLLVGSDDFDFRPSSVREGIERMAEVLDKTDMDIASGRVFGPYEFDLEDQGDVIIEHRVETNLNPMPWFIECSLTVNYSLIKKHVFQKVRWDQKPDVPHSIGGCEHGMFFLDVKRAGYKVAYVPGVQISEQRGVNSLRYQLFRNRSGDSGRACCDLRGVRKYVLGSGKIDYEKK